MTKHISLTIQIDEQTARELVDYLSELAILKLNSGVAPQSIIDGPLKAAAYLALLVGAAS